MKRSRIVVRDLTKTFRDGREVAAVQGASFDILDGEFVAIVGPSGCGKSTILNIIGRLDADGRRGGDRRRAGAGPAPPDVGYVFQKDTVLPWRRVADNIAVGLEYRRVAAPRRSGAYARRTSWPASPASRTHIPPSCRAACASAWR